jgi:type I restriction enzyme S subunit
MKQGWEIKRLGDVCKVIAGQSPEGKYYNDNGNGLPFYQGKKEYGEKYIGEPRTWTSKVTKEAEVNDILMSVRAPVGPINFATQKICIGRGLAAIRATKFIDKEFLFNFLLKHENEIVGNTGAVFNSINKAQIEAIKIPLPPLPEQQRIVAILEEAFAAIAKAKSNAEQNLKNAKELFESYLQNVFDTKGKDWEEKTLGEVLLKTESVDPTKKPDEEFIYLDVSSVNKETKEIENASSIMGKNAPSRARKLIRTNDVIFATVRPTHSRVALITEEYNKQVCSTGYFVLRAKDFLNNNLVYFFVLTYGFNKQMEKLQKGASYPAVNDSDVKGIIIPFPKSLKEQQTIVQKLNALSTETKKLEAIYQQKTNDLEELKKSVLQKAFAGELKEKSVLL